MKNEVKSPVAALTGPQTKLKTYSVSILVEQIVEAVDDEEAAQIASGVIEDALPDVDQRSMLMEELNRTGRIVDSTAHHKNINFFLEHWELLRQERERPKVGGGR